MFYRNGDTFYQRVNAKCAGKVSDKKKVSKEEPVRFDFDKVRYDAFFYGLSPTEFSELNLAETLTYIIARSEAKQEDRNDITELIRWHGYVLAVHFGNKRVRKPEDLFRMPKEIQFSENRGQKYEPTEADLALKEKMRLAALSYQKNKYGNNRKRNN